MARIVRYIHTRNKYNQKEWWPVIESSESEYWRAPQIWQGGTAFILGGGPSLKQLDLTPLHRGAHVIGCNDAYTLGTWVDVCIFGDQPWFDLHDCATVTRSDGSRHPGLRAFGGLLVSVNRQMLLRNRRDIRNMYPEGAGLWRKPHKIGWNGNVGLAAINLALHFGTSRIVLLGFDMHNEKETGDSNWHDNLRHSHEPDWAPDYSRFLKNAARCRKHHKRFWPHVDIVNATPGSALKEWPIVDPENELRQ